MKTIKIYGPPGTGKTEALLGLFNSELRRHSTDQIAFCTFTRAAREEALNRSGFGAAAESKLKYLRTIHSLCFRELRLGRNRMVTPKLLKAFGATLGIRLSGKTDPMTEDLGDSYQAPAKGDLFVQLYHLSRHRGIPMIELLRNAPGNVTLREIQHFIEHYEFWKRREGLYDFTDLLVIYLQRGNPLPVAVIFIDEAQDLSPLQWEVVNKLGANVHTRYLAGDDDQAIFVWAGASAQTFNKIKAANEWVLPKSYRVPRQIFKLAQTIIARVRNRKEKEFQPADLEGSVERTFQADYLPRYPAPIFMLFRNAYRGVHLGMRLEEAGVPFLGANSIIQRYKLGEIFAAWRDLCRGREIYRDKAQLLVNMSSKDWLVPGIKERELGETIRAEDIYLRKPGQEEWPRTLFHLPRKEFLAKCNPEEIIRPRITLMSIHQSKGREAPTICLDTELARRTYSSMLWQPEDEHRVWYVAVTRAKERLGIMEPGDIKNYAL